MKKVVFLFVFLSSFAYSQKSTCPMSYKNVLKIFNSNSLEDIDTELKKYNYIFDFNSSYSNYWNEKQKSNFSIYRDETTNEINLVTLGINENCYQSLKNEIISEGFIKVGEKPGKYRLDFFYKKDDIYVMLAKTNTFDIDGKVVKHGFDFTIISESEFYKISGK